ncbi:serine/threonine-protein kinase pim-3-like [Esox lucius]|uniref:serine/threonine-protein kinase pim-3-like n=1 Tax=Esox lucius TaxID=8010 RepID=UPI001476D54D|nr:serine/threonine-protein kinase pim-3-like [Esox lucius]
MDLSDYCMAMGGKLDQAVARDIMHQVAVAMQHCQNRGVFHCNIKMENLLADGQYESQAHRLWLRRSTERSVLPGDCRYC